jgi:Ca-activated chloride channel family protein
LDALGQFSSSRRLRFVVFVGRGRSTVGVTKPETILEAVHRENKARARIFALGVGEHADVALLDKMATSNRGGFLHAKNAKLSEALVPEFLSRVSPPLVADLSFQFQGLQAESVNPDPIPDIFSPEGRNVLGRYPGETEITSRVRLKARVQGHAKAVTRTVIFPREDKRYPYIPGLWAMRETAALMEKDLLKGPDYAVRREITKLAVEFGFKVPSALSDALPRTPSMDSEFAGLLWQFKTSNVISDVTAQDVRIIGSRVFRFAGTGWTDGEGKEQLPTRTVPFLSDEYFTLVKNHHQLGAFFALGPDVTLVWGDELLHTTRTR